MCDELTYKELERKIKELENVAAEHERMKQVLLKSEERYRLLAENVTDVIWAMDENLNLTYISPSIRRLSGFTPEEAIKQTPLDQLTPPSLELAYKTFFAHFQALENSPDEQARPVKMELEDIRKDGSTGWSEVNTTLLRSPEGSFSGIVGVSRDITERKRLEEELKRYRDHLEQLVAQRTDELRKSNEELQREITQRKRTEKALREERDFSTSLIQTSPTFFVALSPELKTLMMNDMMLSELGYEKAEALGADYLETFIPESDHELIVQSFENMVGSKEPILIESHVLTKDGRKLLVEWHTRQLLKENGEVDSFFGVGIEITERKKAENALREREERYERAERIGHFGHWDGDFMEDWNVWSEGTYRIFGIDPVKFKPTYKAFLNFVHPEDREKLERAVQPLIKQGGEIDVEYRIIRPDGQVRFIHSVAEVHLDKNGKPWKSLGMLHDITERKRAEEALKESEERFRLLMEHSPLSMAVYDSDGRQVAANRAMEKQWLIERTETLGKFNVLDSDFIREQGILDYIQEAYTGRTVHTPEIEIDPRAAFGTSRPRFIQSHLYPLPSPEGSVAGIVVVDEDVTDRKRAQDELRMEKEFIETALDAQLDTFFLFEPATRKAVRWNRSFSRISGYTDEEIARMPAPDSYYSPKDLERASAFIQEVLKEGTGTIELELICKNDRNVPTEYRVSAIKDKQGEPKYIISIGRDITDRKRAEEVLRESDERFRGIFEHTNSGVAVYKAVDDGEDFVFLDFNPRGEEIDCIRREDVIGKRVSEAFPGVEQFGLLDVFRRVWRTGKPEHHPITMYQDDRVQGWRENFVYRLHGGEIVSVYDDITERKRMEEEIARTRRLESLGILAGGLAHDFNNLLTPILANLSIAKTYGDFDPEIAEMLTDAEKASLRAKGLTQQLLTFAKGGAPIKKTVSLLRLLKDTVEFTLSGSNVRCEYSIHDDLWPLEVDEGQISQVIQNMVINADQAMAKGGIMKIRAENLILGEEEHVDLKAGRYVRISVEDQGHGIPQEQLSNIFDPFFTTKEKGRGLGLSTSVSIVTSHKGHIHVDSETGVGTIFHMYLPASEKEPEIKETAKEKPIKGEGKVLVIDDEESIRKSTRVLLRRLGYQVQAAKDNEEGITLYEKAMEGKHPFDTVIMDLTIPGSMGTQEAIKKLKKVDRDAKVIVSSGYSDDRAMSEFREYGFCGVVAKPYGIEDLARVLHNVLKGVEG